LAQPVQHGVLKNNLRRLAHNIMSKESKKPVVVALDVGSSGIKALGFDLEARAVPGLEARTAFALELTTDGGSEVNLLRLEKAVGNVLDELHARLEGFTVLGVGLASFVSSLVALGVDGQALQPALSYADTRSVRFVADLREDTELLERTGCPAYSSLWAAQIPWWLATHPGAKVAKWMTVPDWLFSRWFGLEQISTSYSLAAWTGMLDRKKLEWDRVNLARLKRSSDAFLPLADFDTAHVGLLEPFRTRWPMFADVPFFPAVGDGSAANVGSGALGRDRIAVTVGTTAAVRAVLNDGTPRIPPGLWSYRVTRNHALVGGALTEGGNLFAWARNTLRLEGNLEAQLGALEPDAHGLTVVTSFAGERSPGYRPDARGTVHGLSLATTPMEVLRAVLEGVTYRLADLIERLQPMLEPDAQIILTGNAMLGSSLWSQMLSDVLGRPVITCDEPEATSRGAAILTLKALGLGNLESFPARLGRVFEPNPEHHAMYHKAIGRQRALIEKLV
jgi:gluconokinase